MLFVEHKTTIGKQKKHFWEIVIFKKMIEDLLENVMNEFQKYNMRGICVLGSCLFNQYIPDSKLFNGFLNMIDKYYCLHVWIEYQSEIYDIGIMYNIRTIPMLHLLLTPQYAIEEIYQLESKADDHEEYPLQLKNFEPLTFYKNAPQHIKKCI